MPSDSSIAQLTLGGGATVAAHRRHDERLGAELAQPADRAAQQLDASRQAPAAGADGDGHAGGDVVAQTVRHLVVRLGLDVVDRLAGGRCRARPRSAAGR